MNRYYTMRAAIAVLLTATSVSVAYAEIEPRLLSAWQATLTNQSGLWVLRFQPEYDGRYRTRFTGPFPAPEETGTMQAVDGRWTVTRDDGTTDGGSYVFATDDVVTFTGAGGTVVWQRVSSLPDPPATTTEAAMAPALPGAAQPISAAEESVWPPGDMPSRAAALLERAHQWKPDAILASIEAELLASGSATMHNLNTPGGRALLKFVFCSPTSRKRYVITPAAPFGETWEGEAPDCRADRTPPADFMDLPLAVDRARVRGLVDGDPVSASLDYVTGVVGESASGWMWRIHPPRYSGDQVYEIPVAVAASEVVRRIDACALLTAEDARGVVGDPQLADPGYLATKTWGCAWSAVSNPAARVSLVVDENPYRDAAGFIDNRLRGGRLLVEDLGERAVIFDSPTGFAELDILLGDTLLQLSLARNGAGRDAAIQELGHKVVSRVAQGQGISADAGPLARIRGNWSTTVAGHQLHLRVDDDASFHVSVAALSRGVLETTGRSWAMYDRARRRILGGELTIEAIDTVVTGGDKPARWRRLVDDELPDQIDRDLVPDSLFREQSAEANWPVVAVDPILTGLWHGTDSSASGAVELLWRIRTDGPSEMVGIAGAGGYLQWQSRRSRVIVNPSPALKSLAQSLKIRALYGAGVIEEGRLQADAIDLQGHDLSTVHWTRIGSAPAAAGMAEGGAMGSAELSGAIDSEETSPVTDGPSATVTGGAEAAIQAVEGTVDEATSSVQAASPSSTRTNIERKVDKVGSKLNTWTGKAAKKLDSLFGQIKRSSDRDN